MGNCYPHLQRAPQFGAEPYRGEGEEEEGEDVVSGKDQAPDCISNNILIESEGVRVLPPLEEQVAVERDQ